MNEVSCRVFQQIHVAETKYGVARDRVISGLKYDWAYLSNPKNRIDWSEFIGALRSLMNALNSEEKFKALTQEIAFHDTERYNGIAGFFASLTEIYATQAQLFLKMGYTVPIYTLSPTPDGTLTVIIEIPEPYEASREFMLGSSAALVKVPNLIGLPDATVDETITDRKGVFRLKLPRERSLLRRLSLLPRSLMASVSFFRILKDQHAELSSSYLALSREMKNFQGVVEASTEGIAVVREGKVVHANPALARLLRLKSAESIIGTSSDRWAKGRRIFDPTFWEHPEAGSVCRREGCIELDGGEKVNVEVVAPQSVSWENKPATLWILRDITERKALETAVTNARQREQTKLARDLHDGLGQHLTGLAFKLRALETRLTRAQSPDATTAAEMVDIANRATTQARDLAHGLSPVDLDPKGLEPALVHLCHSVSTLFNLDCRLKIEAPIPSLSHDWANQLYRATQEAISNAHRHGKASSIVVTIRTSADEFLIVVEDDGSGFPADFDVRASLGMGLKIIHHRLVSVGGRLRIETSDTLKGARLIFSLARNERASDSSAPVKAGPKT